MTNATNANRSGHQQEYGNKKTFVPWDQWIKLSQEQKDMLIAERQKERMNSNKGKPRTPYPPRQANAHEVDEVADIDDIIDYNMLNHDGTVDDYDIKVNMTDTWLVVVHWLEPSVKLWQQRRIHNKVRSGTGTSRKVNASKSTQVLSRLMIALTICNKESHLKLMVISTSHIRLKSNIGSTNMMLLASNTRLLIAVLTVVSVEMTCW
jgi:hypothetical protein